jgi:hypothetical protein
MDASAMHWLLIVLFVVGALIALIACGLPRPTAVVKPALARHEPAPSRRDQLT